MKKQFYISLFLLLLHSMHINAIGSNHENDSSQQRDKAVLIGRSPLQYNHTSFSNVEPRYLLNQEVLDMNKDFQDHPELGVITNAPCDDCYEVLEKRTATSRTFYKIGSRGSQFYIMNANEPINYMSPKGEWLSIPRQTKEISEGIFSLPSSRHPITANTRDGFIEIGKEKNQIKINSHIDLIFKEANGQETSLGKIDWNNYTAGDDGIHLMDAWPGIDVTMTFSQGRIKTDFIIKSALTQYAHGNLIIREKIDLNEGMKLTNVGEGDINRFKINNANGETIYTIGKAIAFENNRSTSDIYLDYQKKSPNTLDLTINGKYLNLPAGSYPFIIDPLFSATDSLEAYTMGSKNGGLTSPCSYTNYVNVPEAIQITGLKFTFGYEINYISHPGVTIDEVSFSVRIDSENNTKSCSTQRYACENKPQAPGTIVNQCYATTFIPIHDDLKDCYPPPQCESFPLPVVLDFFRVDGDIESCNSQRVAFNYLPFVVVVEGRTLELNYPIEVSGGSFNVCRGDSVDLTVKPEMGVPPYSYFWQPGGYNTRTITVSPERTTNYVVKVVDMCDNMVSADIELKVKEPSDTLLYKTICSSHLPYAWNGISIQSSGKYTFIDENQNGCDSVITLDLKVDHVTHDTVTLTGCSNVEYKGVLYDSSTVIQEVSTAAFSGCDSLIQTVIIDVQEPDLWFPNAFSPNGDGQNDFFGPELIGKEIQGYQMSIYNKWGSVAFKSFNLQDKWDGTVAGKPADAGTYFVVINALCDDKMQVVYKGNFTLIR